MSNITTMTPPDGDEDSHHRGGDAHHHQLDEVKNDGTELTAPAVEGRAEQEEYEWEDYLRAVGALPPRRNSAKSDDKEN